MSGTAPRAEVCRGAVQASHWPALPLQWCPPCRALLPELRKASIQLFGQLKFGTLDCTMHDTVCTMVSPWVGSGGLGLRLVFMQVFVTRSPFSVQHPGVPKHCHIQPVQDTPLQGSSLSQ